MSSAFYVLYISIVSWETIKKLSKDSENPVRLALPKSAPEDSIPQCPFLMWINFLMMRLRFPFSFVSWRAG